MKIAVGMSAGVDSTTTAKLLKEQGHDVFGVTMKLWNNDARAPKAGSCYGPYQDVVVSECRRYADIIGIDYYSIDVSEYFEKYVIDYVINSYKNALTPNPCIQCNSLIKFGALFEGIKSLNIEFDKFATGHYAGIEYNDDTKRYMLLVANDLSKDQSYFLYKLTQEQLSKIMFPMYKNTKEDTRKLAHSYELDVADKSESQDFFAGEYHRLFEDNPLKGEIVLLDTEQVLGFHNGIFNYTIGQRKGLNVYYKEALYVVAIDKDSNRVYVSTKEKTLIKECNAYHINWVSIAKTDKPFRALVKTRSAGHGNYATVTPKDDMLHIEFDEPATIVAKGQSAVCYKDNMVLCGGIIY